MSTAIPSAMSFELLSRLPANSFVLVWKELRPDQVPQGNEYVLGARDKIRFVLRGAPNEFVLNTNMYLCGNAYLKLKVTSLLEADQIVDEDLGNFAVYPDSYLHAPYHFFQSSRESFNAGALPYLDNQDIVRSHEINNLRFASARRNRNQSKSSLQDLSSAFYDVTNSLQIANIQDDQMPASGPVRLLYYGESAPAGVKAISFGKDWSFQIPLGLYSNFVNSHSVLPVGLTSSYAVNGWQIELETTEQSGRQGRAYNANTHFLAPKSTAPGNRPLDLPVGVMKDLRIYAPYIRVLDPAVMEAVLSLYEKRETVAVGGVQFPLSLRINTMAYRFATFPLIQNQKDYFFRIAGTDRSVRAYAWWVYKKSQNTSGVWQLSSDNQVKVSRLETMIGTEHVHEVVEDVDTTTNNVSNFVNINGKHSAAMFSPLPYYEEGRQFEGLQEDDLDKYNNTLNNFVLPTSQPAFAVRNSLCYGYVSLENLDRRESDYSGSFQASGKDLTNVGAIEVRMRLEKPQAPVVTAASTIGALDRFDLVAVPDADYEIIFAYAYDSVFEVSPQGVMDTTNAVL